MEDSRSERPEPEETGVRGNGGDLAESSSQSPSSDEAPTPHVVTVVDGVGFAKISARAYYTLGDRSIDKGTDEGRWTVPEPGQRPDQVTFRAYRYRDRVMGIEEVLAADEIELFPARCVRVRVLDRNGSPVPRAWVCSVGSTWWKDPGEVVTRADGTAYLPMREEGVLEIVARKDGVGAGRGSAAGTTEDLDRVPLVELRIDGTAWLEFDVTDPDGGSLTKEVHVFLLHREARERKGRNANPVGGARNYLRYADARGLVTQNLRVGPPGHVRLEGLRPGIFDAVVVSKDLSRPKHTLRTGTRGTFPRPEE